MTKIKRAYERRRVWIVWVIFEQIKDVIDNSILYETDTPVVKAKKESFVNPATKLKKEIVVKVRLLDKK